MSDVDKIQLVEGQRVRVTRKSRDPRESPSYLEMFEIGPYISYGAFGVISHATYLTQYNLPVVIKAEKSDHPNPLLKHERNVYV